MPDIEVYGPVSLNDITTALRGAPGAGDLSFVRGPKNVTDIDGKSASYVRIVATKDYPLDTLGELVARLKPIVGTELTILSAWIPQDAPKPVQEAQP